MEEKKNYYENLYKELQEEDKQFKRQYSLIATWRAIAFLLGVFLVIVGLKDGKSILTAAGVLAFVLFLYFVSKHIKVEQAMKTCHCKAQVVARFVARFDENWRNFPETGSEFLKADDTVSHDIDLLGSNSLYQLLSVCHTANGKKKLADSFGLPKLSEEERNARNEAIIELSKKMDSFGINYETAGDKISAHKRGFDEDAFQAYCKDERMGVLPGWARFVGIAIPFAFFTSLLLWIVGPFGYGLPLAVFLVCLVTTWLTKTTTDSVILPLCVISSYLDDYLEMMEIINDATFEAARLKEMQSLISDKNGALPAFHALRGICQAYNISFNPLIHQIGSGTLAWDYQLAAVAARWKRKYGSQIGECFSVLGSFEELLSLAVISVVRKTSNATITNEKTGKCYLNCEELFHPLIAQDKVQANSANLSAGITIVTGSNMSGKTTFLRTLAINLALAYMGAPICGKSLSAGYMKLFTSMRVTDDVAHGISTFYAEIMRIKAMADYRENRLPMLCLIDEIFKGTNSADRIVGATEAIRRLAGDCCMTIVSTHDFELCEICDMDGNPAKNYHFEEYYEETEEGSKLCFDYKIKNGRCTTTNAREILRMAGFVVQ